MAHLTKQNVYNIEDSNIALLGSDVSLTIYGLTMRDLSRHQQLLIIIYM